MTQTARPTIGQYTIGERIAADDLGEVYRAYHRRQMGREVAIRTLPQELTDDALFIQRFDLGLATLASLIHPQIVPILGHGAESGVYYLITPLIGSDNLQERLSRGPLAVEDLLAYLWALADALDYAHSHGIIHGDLRPANVHLDSQGNIVLADFGIARLVEASAGVARSLSPQRGADARGDIYDLGRIAYLGLTGYEPGGSATLASALAHWPTTVSVFRIVLATEPVARHATAGEFVRDLAAALGATREEQIAINEVEAALDTAEDAPEPQASGSSAQPRSKPRLPGGGSLAGILPQTAAARRVFAIWVVAIVLLGVMLGGAVIALGDRDTSPAPKAAAVAPTKAPVVNATAQALAPAGDLPYQFPVNVELIARKYAEAQGKLPPEIIEGAQLQRFAAECADPRKGGDCLLVYVFYSKQTDQMYNYHFKVLEDALVGEFLEPAVNDDYRITFNELPWVRNPQWTNLLRESFAQLPTNYAPGGFSAALVSNPAAFNVGTADWTLVYVEHNSNNQQIFELSGETIVKIPQ